MPRPSKLTVSVGERIVQLVRVGNYSEVAAAAVGVAAVTVRQWARMGLDGEPGPFTEPTDGEELMPYTTFAAALFRARAEAEAASVARIVLAGERDWRASAFWLERRHPQRWARRSAIDHRVRGDPDRPLVAVVVATDVTAEVRERLLAILERRKSPGLPPGPGRA